ncbi:MAG: 2-C-methyl-D-erythritol 2,4-cyclodiphosphate synthase [Dehalococcoidia bacterium]
MKIGFGFDAHAFAPGRALLLGGVDVPHDAGLAGHSDGDALAHAVIDALLGAAGLGDIGGMFPSTDERWRDADSMELLRLAAVRVREAGHRVANVDATVVAQTPRIGPHAAAMRARLAAALGAEEGAVNVKATTTDGMGFTGRGEGIAAFAAALLE